VSRLHRSPPNGKPSPNSAPKSLPRLLRSNECANEAIAQVSPATALAVGLKVDVDALPDSLSDALRQGKVDLNDPANTVALLQLNAVIGVTGGVSGGTLTSMGVQCSLCHSTVDDSLAPGIGHRLDGWANRDLNIGAIIALAPDLSGPASLLGVSQDTVRTVLRSWGPGKFDAELFLDGKAFRPDGKSAAVLIPPAFGLAGVNLHTWTGWGSMTYWNACRQPRDARQGKFLRSAPRRPGTVSGGGESRA
jgi:hypothetical protein